MAALSPFSFTSYFDPANGAVKQVSMYFYRAGTLDPITVYTTSELGIPHPVPVISSGYGRVPAIWLGIEADPAYRVRVFDQYSVLVEDVDNIPGPSSGSGGGGGEPDPIPEDLEPRLYKTGDLIFMFSNNQPREGAILCNGQLIGRASSSTANYANDDTYELFRWLWGQDLNGLLPMNPPRGATADGDWTAGKAIAVPDLRGRTLVGLTDMGLTDTNRLAGVPMQAGTSKQVGATGGEALHTLLIASLPAHKHTLNDPKHTHPAWTGNHQHTVSGGTDVQGAHAHNIGVTVSSAGSHHHDYNRYTSSGAMAGLGSNVSGLWQGVTTGVNTSTDGAHTHPASGSADVQGAHAHNFSGTSNLLGDIGVGMNAVATGITMDNIGGDGTHNTTPLFMAVAVYIKM